MKFLYILPMLILYFYVATANAAELKVTATGTVKAKPNMATFEFGVVSHDPSAEKALDISSKATSKILNVLHNDNLNSSDIQTSSLLVYPEQNKNDKTTYGAENNIVVRIKNLNMLSKIYKDIIVNGANQTSNLTYTNQDTTELFNEARIRAVHNAIAKAKLLSKAANLKLGDITKIESYVNRGGPSGIRVQAMAIGADSATPMEQGVITYTADVTITFNLEKY